MEKELVLQEANLDLCETLKLTKNTKGYTWEIRLRCKENGVVDESTIKRMEDLNDQMSRKFESGGAYEN